MATPEPGVARVTQEVTAVAVQSVAFSQGELFRLNTRHMVEELTPAWLRACQTVETGGRIRISLTVRVVPAEEEAGDGD